MNLFKCTDELAEGVRASLKAGARGEEPTAASVLTAYIDAAEVMLEVNHGGTDHVPKNLLLKLNRIRD